MVCFKGRVASWGRRLRISALAGLAALCASVAMGQTGAALVIGNDRGGFIGARAVEIAQINQQSTRIELRGRVCYSSCTMYLGVDDVCISKTTTFGFHGPSRQGAPLAPRQFEHWSEVMANHYNTPLRDWFMQEARHRTSGYYRVSGATLIALGYPAC